MEESTEQRVTHTIDQNDSHRRHASSKGPSGSVNDPGPPARTIDSLSGQHESECSNPAAIIEASDSVREGTCYDMIGHACMVSSRWAKAGVMVRKRWVVVVVVGGGHLLAHSFHCLRHQLRVPVEIGVDRLL